MNPFATATDLLADHRAGRVASSALTEMCISRVEKHDERRNAVVITVKGSFNVSGLRATCGVPEWKDFVSVHDAPAWARPRARRRCGRP
jgi:Asp-tRNA(Asn)/Glu-tRNA(Gln) amidotransferase A subunit family amidase